MSRHHQIIRCDVWGHASPTHDSQVSFCKKQVYRRIASARVASPRCMARTWQQQIRIQHEISFPTNTNICLSGNVESCRSTSKIFFSSKY